MPLTFCWLFGAGSPALARSPRRCLSNFFAPTRSSPLPPPPSTTAMESPTPPTPVLRSRPSAGRNLNDCHRNMSFEERGGLDSQSSTPMPSPAQTPRTLGGSIARPPWPKGPDASFAATPSIKPDGDRSCRYLTLAVLGTIALFAWWPVAQQYLWQQHSHSAEEGLAHVHLFHEPHCRGESVTLRRSADLYAPAPALALMYHSHASPFLLTASVPLFPLSRMCSLSLSSPSSVIRAPRTAVASNSRAGRIFATTSRR